MRCSMAFRWHSEAWKGLDSLRVAARSVDPRRIRPVNVRQFFLRVSPIDWLTFDKPVERSLFVSIHSRQYTDHPRLVSKRQVRACRGDGRRGNYCMCIELQPTSSRGVAWTLVMPHLIELVDIRICTIDDVHETLVRNNHQGCVFLWQGTDKSRTIGERNGR